MFLQRRICAQFLPIWCHCLTQFTLAYAMCPHCPQWSNSWATNSTKSKCSKSMIGEWRMMRMTMRLKQCHHKNTSVFSWIGWPHRNKTAMGQDCAKSNCSKTIHFPSIVLRCNSWGSDLFNFIFYGNVNFILGISCRKSCLHIRCDPSSSRMEANWIPFREWHWWTTAWRVWQKRLSNYPSSSEFWPTTAGMDQAKQGNGSPSPNRLFPSMGE